MNVFNNPFKFFRNPQYRAIIGLLVLFLLLIIIFFVIYDQLDKKENATNTNPVGQPAVIGEVKIEEGMPTEFERDETFSYSGEVTKIEGDKILFETTYISNLKIIRNTMTATTTSRTEISKRDLAVVDELGLAATYESGRTKISLDQIKPGDNIMVLSTDNIKNLSAFVVSKVEVQYRSK